MIKWASKISLMLRPSSKNVEDNALEIFRSRLYVVGIATILSYLVLIFRLFDISLSSSEDIKITSRNSGTDFFVQRADIVDRNGVVLATNLTTASLYANPQKIINPKNATEKLCTTFADLDCVELYEKLSDANKSFIWIARHLSPKQQQIAYDLAIPGLYFTGEEKRVYPHDNLFAHMIGFVDLDGAGMAGIERYFNSRLLKDNSKPLELSVDVRVQQILREEIEAQVKLHDAIGGSGIVMEAKSGEVMALVSLPDYDPNAPGKVNPSARFNQITLGAYEMGSTFKVLTLAMALDGKFVEINDAFDTKKEILIGNHKITDYRGGKGGMLSVPEILMYSSNIGTAQIGIKAGITEQKRFLEKFGMFSLPELEIHEKANSIRPSMKNWGQSSLISVSFGHGIAVTPLHCARAFAAIVNGGNLVKTTLLKTDESEQPEQAQVLSNETSNNMRKMLRLVTRYGSAKKANIDGMLVGGKTGTAEKVINGRYSKTANLSSFIGAFPMNDPKYVILVMIDEAKKNEINHGFTTGGMIAAPVAGNIINRIAPVLNIKPVDDLDQDIIESMQINFQPRFDASTR